VPDGSGQVMPFSAASFRIFDTVLREHGMESAMFRSLNPKFFNLRIS